MICKTWPATLNSLISIQAFIKDRATLSTLPANRLPTIHIIVEEIVVNIINHAYKGTESESLSIGFQCANDRLTLSFSDTGSPFDPLKAEIPDTTKDIDERDIGGLGLFMVTQMADEVEYKRKDNKNILTVTLNTT